MSWIVKDSPRFLHVWLWEQILLNAPLRPYPRARALYWWLANEPFSCLISVHCGSVGVCQCIILIWWVTRKLYWVMECTFKRPLFWCCSAILLHSNIFEIIHISAEKTSNFESIWCELHGWMAAISLISSNGCSCVVGSWGAPPGNWATCMQRNWSAVVDRTIL